MPGGSHIHMTAEQASRIIALCDELSGPARTSFFGRHEVVTCLVCWNVVSHEGHGQRTVGSYPRYEEAVQALEADGYRRSDISSGDWVRLEDSPDDHRTIERELMEIAA